MLLQSLSVTESFVAGNEIFIFKFIKMLSHPNELFMVSFVLIDAVYFLLL